MSVESGLEKIRKSSILWIVGGTISLTGALAVNAAGLYSRVEQQGQLLVQQHDLSMKLEANQQSLALANATNSARLDADERRITLLEEEARMKGK